MFADLQDSVAVTGGRLIDGQSPLVAPSAQTGQGGRKGRRGGDTATEGTTVTVDLLSSPVGVTMVTADHIR